MRKMIFSLAVLAMANGCTKTTSFEAETPVGHTKTTEDAYHRTTVIKTTDESRECMSYLAPQYGSANAYLTCSSRGSQATMGGFGATGMMGGNYAPVMTPGGGVVVPGSFMGYPGNAPIVVTGPGAVSAAPAGGGVWVPGTGSATGAAPDRRVEQLGKAVVDQECRLLALENKPCPKADGDKPEAKKDDEPAKVEGDKKPVTKKGKKSEEKPAAPKE